MAKESVSIPPFGEKKKKNAGIDDLSKNSVDVPPFGKPKETGTGTTEKKQEN